MELCLFLSGFLQLIYPLIVDRMIEGLKDRRTDEATTFRFLNIFELCIPPRQVLVSKHTSTESVGYVQCVTEYDELMSQLIAMVFGLQS